MEKYAIIVAGGKGLRMGSVLPKQFLVLNGKPILMHTLLSFYEAISDVKLVLVLPKAQHKYWQEQCEIYKFSLSHQLANGGEERFDSVANGLKFVPDQALVAIHDGVRPLVESALIERLYEDAEKFGSAVPVVRVKDSVRQCDGEESSVVDRENLRLVQTPQTFQSSLIKAAFGSVVHNRFTDDASVYESFCGKIHLVEGDHRNIKITTPEDILIAEAFLK